MWGASNPISSLCLLHTRLHPDHRCSASPPAHTFVSNLSPNPLLLLFPSSVRNSCYYFLVSIPEAVSRAGFGACQDHNRKQDQITRHLHTSCTPSPCKGSPGPCGCWGPRSWCFEVVAMWDWGQMASGEPSNSHSVSNPPGQVPPYEEKPVVWRVKCELHPRNAALSSASGSKDVIDIIKSGLIPLLL